MDLDEVEDRLYALPPAEFTPARTAEAKAAKDAGEASLAREIAGLRKPTVAAWAVNRAARELPDEMGELLALGEELRTAWAGQDAAALAELTGRRGVVTGRLARLVRERAGLSGAAAAEVEQTLDAATVDAGAAAQVRAGRLVKALSYSGFAPVPDSGGKPAKRGGEKGKAAKRAEEERKARELREATAAYEEWRDALGAAVQARDKRAGKVAVLERKLAKARRKLAEADQRVEVTRREENHARTRVEQVR